MLLIINENSVEHAIGIVGDTKTDFKNVFAIWYYIVIKNLFQPRAYVCVKSC